MSGSSAEPPVQSDKAVLVVVGSPLPADAEQLLTAAVEGLGATVHGCRQLVDEDLSAIVVEVSGAEREAIRAAVDGLGGPATALCVVPTLPPPGQLLVVMDVDSTFLQDEVIELLARHAGREPEVRAVTEAAMRGELDFAESLHARVATLAGLPAEVIESTSAQLRLTPGAERLCRVLHERGDRVALVSGGFTAIIEPLAVELGIHDVRANTLEVVHGRLTGRVLGEVVDRAVKARTLRELADRYRIPQERTVAIGDGANDLDLLAWAGLGIAFNAKPILRDQADAVLDLPRLDAALLLLGIVVEAAQSS